MLFALGCKKENPNPELLDPIYKDLLSEKKETEKLIKDSTAQLEVLKLESEKIEPRSIERKINQRESKKTSEALAKLKQKLKYLEIRTERRRVESRYNYKLSFREDKPWPDPEEYKNYLVSKRLVNAPPNWSARVPKFHTKSPNYREPAGAAKDTNKKEASKE